MRNIFIYALCEPGTRTVRYIGKTVCPKRRLKQHLDTSIKEKTHLGNWLRSLLGAPPNLVILSEVPEAEGSAGEIRFIAAARISLGMKLVNATGGGEGTTGSKRTLEHRANMGAAQKKRWADPERRAAMSAVLTGIPKDPYSPERCAAMSAARKGKHQSSEHRAKLSAAHKKLWSDPERRAAMIAARKNLTTTKTRTIIYHD